MRNIVNVAAQVYIVFAYCVAITIAVLLLFTEIHNTTSGFVRKRNVEKRDTFKYSTDGTTYMSSIGMNHKRETNDNRAYESSDAKASELNPEIAKQNHTENPVESRETSKHFTIGLYHFYHGGLKGQARQVDMSACLYKQCSVKLIGNTGSGPYDVDALLFQGNHLPRKLPVYRKIDQVFVFFNTESPQNLRYIRWKKGGLRNYFNWTMTYRLDSDIAYPYGRVLPSCFTSEQRHVNYRGGYSENDVLISYMNKMYESPIGIVGKDYENVYTRKTKHAAWLVSHCVTASKREQYVKAMQEEVHVDIFGDCSKRTCNRKDPKCEPLIEREYMFYIGFENSLCRDYITEKVYKWFEKDILVVVRGARNYPVHLPKGTYIDADDFDSAASLGRYLTQLAGNKTEYIQMLKRKDSYRLVWHKQLIQLAYCNLCQRLHNLDMYVASIQDVNKWWTHDICVGS